MTAVLSLAWAASAAATVRYAAPGGAATAAQCTSPSGPFCTIHEAAAGTGVVAGDEAVITPGQYSDTAEDLGPNDFVQITPGVNVHGVAGQPRPVIIQEIIGFSGAFLLFDPTVRLAHVEIRGDVTRGSLQVFDGLAEDVIVRSGSSVSQTIVCDHTRGTIRNSVCLASGDGATALGSSVSTFAQNTTINVRNVTAVSTGSASKGIEYTFFGTGVNYTVSVKNAIAQGVAFDARARAGNNAVVAVNLDHSNYDSTSTENVSGGAATITPAGTGSPNFNVTDPPLLAADGYHQLAGSPTINAGIADGLINGTQDIDGQARQVGPQPPDIGADELGISSATALSCQPASLVLGGGATCTAIVSAPAELVGGTVSFSSNTPGGSFGPDAGCSLPSALGSSQCQVTYTPGQVASGNHLISAVYSGDANHEPSQGTASVGVAGQPLPGPTPTGKKKCKKAKKKGKSAGAAVKKKKCKKKKKKK